jgi:hypothetical protein
MLNNKIETILEEKVKFFVFTTEMSITTENMTHPRRDGIPTYHKND